MLFRPQTADRNPVENHRSGGSPEKICSTNSVSLLSQTCPKRFVISFSLTAILATLWCVTRTALKRGMNIFLESPKTVSDICSSSIRNSRNRSCISFSFYSTDKIIRRKKIPTNSRKIGRTSRNHHPISSTAQTRRMTGTVHMAALYITGGVSRVVKVGNNNGGNVAVLR